MRLRAAVLLSGVLATATAVLALPAAAGAAVDGVDVAITEVPDAFEAGAGARTVQVVASTDRGDGCRKVRWSMVLTVEGVDLDQVEVARVEQDDSFPLTVQTEGDTARLTDVRFDPGSLCRGRTVTARYRVAFDDDAPEGSVTFQAQAFDAAARLLQEATATSRVAGAEDDDEEPSPSPSPSESESADPVAVEEPSDEAVAAPAGDLAARPAAAQGGVPSLLGPGLIIGAALVFAGVGLLLRIRMRNRGPGRRPAPAGFHPTR